MMSASETGNFLPAVARERTKDVIPEAKCTSYLIISRRLDPPTSGLPTASVRQQLIAVRESSWFSAIAFTLVHHTFPLTTHLVVPLSFVVVTNRFTHHTSSVPWTNPKDQESRF
jgi:hypothetical protein